MLNVKSIDSAHILSKVWSARLGFCLGGLFVDRVVRKGVSMEKVYEVSVEIQSTKQLSDKFKTTIVQSVSAALKSAVHSYGVGITDLKWAVKLQPVKKDDNSKSA